MKPEHLKDYKIGIITRLAILSLYTIFSPIISRDRAMNQEDLSSVASATALYDNESRRTKSAYDR